MTLTVNKIVIGFILLVVSIIVIFKDNRQSITVGVEQEIGPAENVIITQEVPSNASPDLVQDVEDKDTSKIENTYQDKEVVSAILVPEISSSTKILDIPPVKKPITMLVEELNKLYDRVIATGIATESDKKDFKLLRDQVNNLTDDEKAALIYNEVFNENLADTLDLDLNPVSFISLQGFRSPKLMTLENKSGKNSDSFTKRSTELGLALTHDDDDIISSYFYNDSDQFTGLMRFTKSDNSMRFLHEQIKGIDTRLFGGTVYHMLTNLKSSATFYIMGHSFNFAQVRLEEVNKFTPLTRMEFPVSSSTLVSVQIDIIDEVIHVGKWNFDFDGDDVTDLTLGNAQEFNDEHLELALTKMSKDVKLSESDRKTISQALPSKD